MEGHQRWTSDTQLESVDSGPITMKGPDTPWERRWENRPMVCTCNNGFLSWCQACTGKGLLQLHIPYACMLMQLVRCPSAMDT